MFFHYFYLSRFINQHKIKTPLHCTTKDNFWGNFIQFGADEGTWTPTVAHMNLNHARLPIPPHPHILFDYLQRCIYQIAYLLYTNCTCFATVFWKVFCKKNHFSNRSLWIFLLGLLFKMPHFFQNRLANLSKLCYSVCTNFDGAKNCKNHAIKVPSQTLYLYNKEEFLWKNYCL